MKLQRTTTYSTVSLPVKDSNISYDKLNDYLSALDVNIEAAKKTIEFWDLYGIYSDFSGTSWDELQVAIAALPNNKSLVINTSTPISSGTNIFTRGDIVYKTEQGEVKVNKSISSGTYQPAYDSTNNFIKYEYTTTPETSITLTGVTTASSTYMYSIETTLYNNQNYVIFKQVTINNNIVKPVIKFFYQNEPIYLNYVLETGDGDNAGKYILAILDVDSFTENNAIMCVIR